MKKIKEMLNGLYKKVIKFFNNYRTTAMVLSGVAIVAAIVGILYLVFYALSGGNNGTKDLVAFETQPIIGMIFFISALVVIGISAYTVYASFPVILNREKIIPKKSLLMFSVISAGFQLLIAILTIVLLATEESKVATGFAVVLVFNFLTLIASALAIVPFLKCEFYMPAIIIKEKAKKE